MLKFRTWLCLPCTLHLNMVCFTSDIYFGCFKKAIKKLISMLLLTIQKYFTISSCNKPLCLKGLMLVVCSSSTSKMRFQSPHFLSLT